jgi:hypothetical protein
MSSLTPSPNKSMSSLGMLFIDLMNQTKWGSKILNISYTRVAQLEFLRPLFRTKILQNRQTSL